MIPNIIQIAILLLGIALSIFAMTFQFLGSTYMFVIAEAFFIGGWQAYVALLTWNRLSSAAFDPISKGALITAIPVIIGLLAFTRLTKYRWLSRYYMAVIGGVGSGVIMATIIRTDILAVLKSTATDLVTLNPDPLAAIIVTIGMITSLTYFLYARKLGGILHSPTGRLRWIPIVGRAFLMLSFGYLYAQVFVSEALEQLIQAVIIVFQDQINKILVLLT